MITEAEKSFQPRSLWIQHSSFSPSARLKGYICVECMFTFIHYVLLHPLPSLLATVDRGQGSHAAVGSRDFWRADQTLPTGVPTPQSPFVPLPERLTANEVYHNQNCWAHTDFHEDSMWMCFFIWFVWLSPTRPPPFIWRRPPSCAPTPASGPMHGSVAAFRISANSIMLILYKSANIFLLTTRI